MITMQNGWLIVTPIDNESSEKELIIGATPRAMELEFARVELANGNFVKGQYVAFMKGASHPVAPFKKGSMVLFQDAKLRLLQQECVLFVVVPDTKWTD